MTATSRTIAVPETRESRPSWWVAGGVACLVLGPVGELVQSLVTPVRPSGTIAESVAAAAAHPAAMSAGIVLDLFILLMIPAVLFVGFVAGARRSFLAAIGASLVFLTSLSGSLLLAQDVVIWAAAQQPDGEAAVALAETFASSGVLSGVIVAYLIGRSAGFVLLGIALARFRAVPLVAAISLCVWPFVEWAGGAAGIDPLAVAGKTLMVFGMGACAVALLRWGVTRRSDSITR